MTMSFEERGFYITLLCLQWTKGHITDDDMKRLGSAMAQPSLSHVRSKFEMGSNGYLRNARMEQVRTKQDEFRANRSLSGKAGAAQRWHSHNTANGSAMAQPMANDSSPSPSPSPTPDSVSKPESAEAKPRARSPLFDALASACGANPLQLTKSAARACGVALAEIRAVAPNLQPTELHSRAARYRRIFDGAAISPSALAKHWAECDPISMTPERLNGKRASFA